MSSGGGSGGSSAGAGGTVDATELANSLTKDLVAPTYVPRSGALRLSRVELNNTLQDVFGVSAASTNVLAEDEFSPFDNGLATQIVSAALVEGLQVLAEQVAAEMTRPVARAKFMPCEPIGVTDAACFEQTAQQLGSRLLRRSLSAAELSRYSVLLGFAEESNDFYAAVALLIESLLQDPEFVYRIERGTPTMTPEVYALRANEVATRLAFLVLGSGPSRELLADEALTEPAARAAAIDRLLQDPRARKQLNRFHAMWLGYRAIPHDAELNAAFQQETEALIERVTFEDEAPISELFQSPHTYLTDALADHYGLPRPTGGQGWVTYPADSGRAGILSHGSVLSGFSKFTDTSPTQRGIFVQTRLLCNSIPRPPPTVDVDQPPAEGEPGCKVERYEAHKNQSGCVGCHALFDPIGLGLENFDRAGRYREHDDDAAECKIESSGTLPNIGEFRGPGELAQLLVSNDLIESCFATHYARFALGKQQLDEIDRNYVSHLAEQLTASDGIVKKWLVSLVSDPAFGLRRDALEEK